MAHPEERARGEAKGSGMSLIAVPVQGVKMSSKPSKWLTDVDTNGIKREILTLTKRR